MKPVLCCSLVAVLALAACNQPAPEPVPSESASAQPAPPSSGIGEAAPTAPAATETGTVPVSASFPAAVRGRWALAPDGCSAPAGDTRGLITISGSEIRFFESVATIAAVRDSTPQRLRATLAYEGEGMTWSRDALIEARPGGETLVMQEFGSDAVAGARTYERCK